jgi:hypothetical protein
MKRRRFLGAVALSALWARRALADATVRLGPGARGSGGNGASAGLPKDLNLEHGYLDAALARARAARRDLLVIVIPEAEDAIYLRGRAIGKWLDTAPDAELAPLARVDIVCATAAELQSRVDTSIAIGEPVFALVDPQQPAVRRVASPELTSAAIAPALRTLAGDQPRDAGRAVAAALRKRAPVGSHWASPRMCGYPAVDDLREDDSMAMDCGMGHVGEESRRFLYFYSKSPSVRERERFDRERKPT